MARPREFETEVALEQGMHLLWAQGYEATSLEDLLVAMDLSKSSFYETFGSKHDFLIAALTRYIDIVLGQLANDLREGLARDAIARSFEVMLPSPEVSARGCFVQNCAIELAQRDPDARAKVREGLQRLEDGYYRAVRRGQQSGEFARSQDARALARFLVSSLNGLRVLARAGFARKDLQQVVEVTLRSIR
jgi:TetR/AcrR family transcriptional regulator, transcriptional repressor for nem operon